MPILIGGHVDLEWTYKGHNDFSKYVVEVVRLSETGQHPVEQSWCDFAVGVPCRFVATDPLGKRSRLPLELGAPLPSGTYQWRVVPGDLRAARRGAELLQAGKWSGFGSFTIYPSLRKRIFDTHAVRVGTNFVQDTHFSRRGPNGEPQGYDIDLIRVIVEGCLERSEKAGATYSRDRCRDSVGKFLGSRECASSTPSERAVAPAMAIGALDPNGLAAEIVPVAEWKDWLELLQRKDVDLFIGQATKARQREHGDVAFTSGYYEDQTVILAKKSEPCETLECLARYKRKVGVIAGTTNNWLADLLSHDVSLPGRIEVVKSYTFPALESALDNGEVDAMIIDRILGNELMSTGELKTLNGLDANDTYQDEYLKSDAYIGYGKEEFGIAVANDTKGGQTEGANLRSEINRALASEPVKRLIQCLYREAK